MNLKALALIVLAIASIPLLIIGASVASVSGALAQANIMAELEPEKNKLVVILLNPDCGVIGGDYEATLRGAIAYRQYLDPDFEVACGPTFAYLGLEQIATVMMPILRLIYPDDVFLFVFPDSMWLEFNDYLFNHYSDRIEPDRIKLLIQGEQTIGGVAIIDGGFGFSNEWYNDVRHEMLHLQTCEGHTQGSDSEPTTWQMNPAYAELPWCQFD